MKSKFCSKCGGKMFTDSDTYGAYSHCICCGLEIDLNNKEETNVKGQTIKVAIK
jgi:DNA-directed RNA polymerase subunit M/transcription elongation factor TFIIS